MDLRVETVADGEAVTAALLGLKAQNPDFTVSVTGGMNRPPYERSEATSKLFDHAKSLGATGLVWARRAEDGTITSSIMKALGEDSVRRLLESSATPPGGLLLIAAGEPDATSKLLGQLLQRGRRHGPVT